ncbi:MAG TPA: hypothetical protein VFW63_06025 [Acidimicrobiales bacterium]|nr:hypothetical protein [Acidimicrobiales bacterium]
MTHREARGEEAARTVELPGGAVLHVRPAERDDLEGLTRLYAELDADDRYRRFFSVYRPPPEFFEGMVAASERGGLELVAVVRWPDGHEDLVGEAGYEPLPNGDGELAITVGHRWRGWLGPYLLDALLSAAAARGVPNLEADILLTNGPMLALARSRGCVTMDHPDWSVVRVLIGTSRPTPRWPAGHEGTRVLVEGPGGPWHADAARAAGLEVLACPGPAVRRGSCPALQGRPCPLATDADVIVVRHPDAGGPWPDLLAAHRQAHPGVPVCLEAPGAGVEGEAPVVPRGDDAVAVAFVQRRAAGDGDTRPPG